MSTSRGRDARARLRRRLATARRGQEQLARKLHILAPEQRRLQAEVEAAQRDWTTACAQAQRWSLRVALLGGQAALRAATPAPTVTAEVEWTTAMGLTYPVGIRLQGVPETPETMPNAAVPPALAAHAAALRVGVRLAAATEALRLLDREVGTTRRRLRALEKRWLPQLEDQLRTVELALEQTEQEDGVRLRAAAKKTTDPGDLV